MDPMLAIKNTFFQECEEQLVELETGLLTIDGGEHGSDVVNAVFRAVHSIKGGAGAFGLDALVRFAHVFETALDALRSDRLAPDATVMRVMLRAADLLADLVRAARTDAELPPERSATLEAELAALTSTPGEDAAGSEWDDLLAFQPVMVAAAAPAGQVWRVQFRPYPSLYANANDATVLLRELGRLGAATTVLDDSDLPKLEEMDPEGAYLAWTIELTTDQDESAIREVFEFVDGDCALQVSPIAVEPPEPAFPSIPAAFPIPSIPLAPELPLPQPLLPAQPSISVEPGKRPETAATASASAPATAPASAPATAARATIRVDLDRLDRLIDLVGELVINQAMLAQRVTESGLSRSSGVAVGLEDLEHLTREIQDSVMAIRAQPVKAVFQRLPRLAREVAALTGKEVRLLTEGESTEVDNTVIERLSDPLTHMIRNAIDHGIESPERRVAAGKPSEGTVRVSALHRSGRIVIEVSDDGAGIDRQRVLASAIAKEIVPADAVLSDEEIDNLIFAPGFSTATTVSDISGRGVGMDVVRRSIQALGGRISIASVPGRGSTFSLSLPLTLAVLDGMVVGVEGHRFVVPLTAILETLQPGVVNVHSLGEDMRVVAMRGSYVPLVDVGVALGFRTDPPPLPETVALLIEGEDGSRAALVVDAIHGQRQVVIKSLEANYRHVPGVAAATILGDGRVALILDVDAVVQQSSAASREREAVLA
ncbi:MAG: chemotaxis protein CheA [Acetobacteraceae bacterium]